MIDHAKSVYSVKDVMKILGLARNTLMSLLTTNKIRSVRAGRRWLISSAAIDEFLGSTKK